MHMAWSDVVGHELAKRIFHTHLAAGTVAQAYLLVGPEGIGKRRLGLELAKALNCSGAKPPCDACVTCGQIARGVHPDVHVIEPSGPSAQIKIEDIRQLIGRVALRPFNARVQVAVLDGADRLTEEAANSLLKTLEEPSGYARFILTTSRLAFCLPTIVSRCQLIRCDPRRAGRAGAARAWTPPSAWLEQPLPEGRDETATLLDAMIGWLRDAALARGAEGLEADRCVETAFELMALRESLEQFANPRLVASLAREKWLSVCA